MAKGLYLHIPFCRSICTYCDFPKAVASASLQEEYVQALKSELSASSDQLTDVESIYIGGGTPSALDPALLTDLLDFIRVNIDLDRVKEYTIEANPGDVDRDFVKRIKRGGVDRISLGIQSGNDRLLATMGRTHTAEMAIAAVNTLHDLHFFNINLDFIYAVPGETMADLVADIEFACSLQPTHLSFYTLILEPKTILYHLQKTGNLELIEEELEATMFEAVMRILPERGYARYEISNYAIEGFASKHNLGYWDVREYLGVGMAAHSQLGTTRFHNQPTLSRYLAAVKKTGFGGRIEDACDLVQETCLMGLRKTEGIDLTSIWLRFQTDVLRRYPRLVQNRDEGLIVIDNDRLRLTDKGVLLMNYVERSFQ